MLEMSRSLSFSSSEFPPFTPTICLLVRGLSPSSAAEDIVHLSLIYLTWGFFIYFKRFSVERVTRCQSRCIPVSVHI